MYLINIFLYLKQMTLRQEVILLIIFFNKKEHINDLVLPEPVFTPFALIVKGIDGEQWGSNNNKWDRYNERSVTGPCVKMREKCSEEWKCHAVWRYAVCCLGVHAYNKVRLWQTMSAYATSQDRLESTCIITVKSYAEEHCADKHQPEISMGNN